MFLSTVTKKKKTFEAVLTGVVTLAFMASEPFLVKKMEEYTGRTDIDILDILRLELAPLLKNILPFCVLLFISCHSVTYILKCDRFVKFGHSSFWFLCIFYIRYFSRQFRPLFFDEPVFCYIRIFFCLFLSFYMILLSHNWGNAIFFSVRVAL